MDQIQLAIETAVSIVSWIWCYPICVWTLMYVFNAAGASWWLAVAL